MPDQVRELIKRLKQAGFSEIGSAGKGSHRKFTHPNYPGAVTLSGNISDDAKHYQIRQVNHAIEVVKS